MAMDDIKHITQYAISMLNIPYLWGGNSPIQGIDCSEFAINLLTAYGYFKPWDDTTAHGLWLWAKQIDGLSREKPFEGCLIFYGKPSHVTHIAYSISERLTIQASGGGSELSIKNGREDLWRLAAIKADARVKMLPYDYRKDIVDIRFPFIRSEV